jgi:hypothetical protein
MSCLSCLQYHYASLIALVQNNQQGEGKPESARREGVSGCIPLVPSYLFLNNPPYSSPSTLLKGEQ